MKKTIFFSFLILAIAAALWSDDTVFQITNETGFTLRSLHVAESNTDDWQDDILRGNPLLDGETIAIPLLSLNTRFVDVRAKDDEGDTYTVYDVDTDSEDIAIGLMNIDPD